MIFDKQLVYYKDGNIVNGIISGIQTYRKGVIGQLTAQPHRLLKEFYSAVLDLRVLVSVLLLLFNYKKIVYRPIDLF